ncbi:MAG: hypothetical protein EBU85_05445 [Actinobacteria bacterium]|nr:hypothetical protein [Actinomycetota bacterium]
MPLKSLRQMRYLFAAEKRGDVPKGTAKEFVAATSKKKLAKLPEVVKRKKTDARKLDPLVKARRAGKAK